LDVEAIAGQLEKIQDLWICPRHGSLNMVLRGESCDALIGQDTLMGRAAFAIIPRIDQVSLHQLETHFIASEIYQRDDLSVRQRKLAQLISSKVIPQLLRLHTDVMPEAPPVDVIVKALAPDSADITGLADIVLGSDLEAAVSYVMALRDRGLSMETLFIELLEPTARHLGEMWNHDECDFIDVTLGVARLQKLLAVFNNSHAAPWLDSRRSVLMAMTPGDQHYFGVTMVERFLLASGWKVQTETGGDSARVGKRCKDALVRGCRPDRRLSPDDGKPHHDDPADQRTLYESRHRHHGWRPGVHRQPGAGR
jgi:hypothetical protein